jgi:hypothetical protein
MLLFLLIMLRLRVTASLTIMLLRPSVYIEGVKIADEYLAGVSISIGHNRFMSASITLLAPPDRFSPLKFRTYPNVVITVDGYVIFKGVIHTVSQSRSPQGTSLNLQAVSHWELLKSLTFMLANPLNLPAYLNVLVSGQSFGYVAVPKYVSSSDDKKSTVVISQEAFFLAIFKDIWKKYKEKKASPQFQPVKEFLQTLLNLYQKDDYWTYQLKYLSGDKYLNPETKGTLQLAVREFWKNLVEHYRFDEYLLEYWKYTSALFKLFFESLMVNEAYKVMFENALVNGNLTQTSVYDMLMTVIGLMLANMVELPTPEGPKLVLKPLLHSARPPKPNLLPKEFVKAIQTQGTLMGKPTRTYIQPTSAGIKLLQGVLAKASLPPIIAGRLFITAYPEEVEKQALIEALKLLGKNPDPKKPVEALAQEYYLNVSKEIPPKPFGSVLTEEEKIRGILPNTVPFPESLGSWFDAYKGKDRNFRFWLLLYGYAKLMHLEALKQTSVAQVSTAPNIFAVPGHTILFADNDRVFMGYLEAVTHTFSPQGAGTSYQIVAVEDVTEELSEYLYQTQETDKEQFKGSGITVELDHSEFFGEELTIFDCLTDSPNSGKIRTFTSDDLNDFYKTVYGSELADNDTLKKVFYPESKPTGPLEVVGRYAEVWYRELLKETEETIAKLFEQTIPNEEVKRLVEVSFSKNYLPPG